MSLNYNNLPPLCRRGGVGGSTFFFLYSVFKHAERKYSQFRLEKKNYKSGKRNYYPEFNCRDISQYSAEAFGQPNIVHIPSTMWWRVCCDCL